MLFPRTKQIVINNIRKNILFIGINKGQYDRKMRNTEKRFYLAFFREYDTIEITKVESPKII